MVEELSDTGQPAHSYVALASLNRGQERCRQAAGGGDILQGETVLNAQPLDDRADIRDTV
jgi:hypothetical protein